MFITLTKLANAYTLYLWRIKCDIFIQNTVSGFSKLKIIIKMRQMYVKLNITFHLRN